MKVYGAPRFIPQSWARVLAGNSSQSLHRALQEILKKAIVMRGSSISNFVDADGEPGEYQQHHRAYGREGEKCYRCGAIIRRAIVAGRSSYFLPQVPDWPAGFFGSAVADEQKSRRDRRLAIARKHDQVNA